MLNSLWPVLPALIPLDPRRVTAEVCSLLCMALSAAPGALQPVLSDIVSFMQEAAGHNLVACTELLAVLVERETEALGDNMPRLLEGAFSLALAVIEEVRGKGCHNDVRLQRGDFGHTFQNKMWNHTSCSNLPSNTHFNIRIRALTWTSSWRFSMPRSDAPYSAWMPCSRRHLQAMFST
jgi:hypothetical protein